MHVKINDCKAGGKLASYAVYPGRLNTLTVSRNTDVSTGNEKAVLEIITSDGKIRVEEAEFVNGQARLDIGPLAAPALYEYEHGMVFRRGYRLCLRIKDTASGQTVQEQKFSEGSVF